MAKKLAWDYSYVNERVRLRITRIRYAFYDFIMISLRRRTFAMAHWNPVNMGEALDLADARKFAGL